MNMFYKMLLFSWCVCGILLTLEIVFFKERIWEYRLYALPIALSTIPLGFALFKK